MHPCGLLRAVLPRVNFTECLCTVAELVHTLFALGIFSIHPRIAFSGRDERNQFLMKDIQHRGMRVTDSVARQGRYRWTLRPDCLCDNSVRCYR